MSSHIRGGLITAVPGLPGAAALYWLVRPEAPGRIHALELLLLASLLALGLLAVVAARRGRAVRALEGANRALRSLVDVSPLAFIATDTSDRVTMWNPAAQRMFGWTPEEIIGRLNPLIPAVLHREYECLAVDIVEGRQVTGLERSRQRKDGSLVEVSVSTAALAGPEGDVVGRMAILEDVSERKRAAERQELLSSAIDQSSEGVVIFDLDGPIAYASTGFERMTGITREEAVGRLLREVVGGRVASLPPRDEIRRPLLEAGVWSGRVEYAHPDGTSRTLEVGLSTVLDASGEPSTVIGVLHDATRELALEAQLRQSQKMEAIGQLAGGVAHDFNNILTAIVGFANLVESQVATEQARDDVRQIVAAAQRAANVTRGLLAYSRRQTLRPDVVELGELLRRFERLARPLIGEDVELELAPGAEPLRVRADAVQLEQVLMNLAANARYAMPRGGRLTLSCTRLTLGAAAAGSRGLPGPGEYACMAAADTGVGMDSETQQHVFEPFFTTKPVGEGSGLGLAVVYGILRQHRGAVEVESSPGHGAVFRLYLPVHGGSPCPGAEAAAAPPAEAPRGDEVVLLAEDDASIRALVSRALEEHGYRVLAAPDGEAALARFHDSPGIVGLLLLDAVMPRLSGPDVLAAARRIRPEVPALLMSGYAAELLAGLAGDVEIVSKPVGISELLCKVRHTLDAARSRS